MNLQEKPNMMQLERKAHRSLHTVTKACGATGAARKAFGVSKTFVTLRPSLANFTQMLVKGKVSTG